MNSDKSNSEDQARAVIERMATLRRELTHDVEDVAESAKAMTDWTFYVRRFPWAAVGLAAAVGFLLVPRKKTVVTPTAEQLVGLAKNQEFVAAATAQLKPARSMLSGLAATVAAMAGRAALTYITDMIREKAAQARQQPSSPATASSESRDIEY